jgi:hypothetical protein
MKEVLYKLLTIERGHFEKINLLFKNNAKVFLELVDFRKCQE